MSDMIRKSEGVEEKSNQILKFSLLTVAFAIIFLLSSLVKQRFRLEHNNLLFSIALFSFIGFTARIFGEGKGNKFLSLVFWTMCLLMIVDIRVTDLNASHKGSLQHFKLKSDFVQVEPSLSSSLNNAPPQHEGEVRQVNIADEEHQKMYSILRCFHHCNGKTEDTSNHFSLPSVALKNHFVEVLEATKTFRPQKRRKRTVYRDYLGPRLEDHFIHNMFAEPFETFAPMVPLFIHWTEVYYSKTGGGTMKLMSVLEKTLRKDVIYFSVASCETHKIQARLKTAGFTVIFASSKGDPAAHIILPHLFRFNAPGYTSEGESIFDNELYKGIEVDYDYSFPFDVKTLDKYTNLSAYDINRAYHEKVVYQRMLNDIPKTSPLWRFKNYSTYFSMNEETDRTKQPLIQNTFAQKKKFSFLGNLKTHHKRRDLIRRLQKEIPENFIYENFVNNEQCVDYSAGTDHSPCWRSLMLSTSITLAPVGTAPVSYRLYEALQMGTPAIYIYDDRGPFIPYKDTQADIERLGLLVSFEEASKKIFELNYLSDESFLELTKNLRRNIARLRDTHFSPHGVIGQLKSWLKKPHDTNSSDIRCCKNPMIA